VTPDFTFNVAFNGLLIPGAGVLAFLTVRRVLGLPGSRLRKTITAIVLFPTVLFWLSTFVLGAFDDFGHPLIEIESYLRLMQITFLLMLLLFYIYTTRPHGDDRK
jgi:hypothetical protein